MRNLKRVLALALALVMVLGMMVIGSSAASYTDASAIDSKYAEAVEVLTGMGIFKGQDANNFAPKAQLTRAEASALIYRVITGDVTDSKIALYDYASFNDVAEGAWSTGYITYAANGGYVKGDGTGNFNPTDYVTGVQVLAIMLRAIGYGQNGEYEGAAWKDNVLTDAYDLYITEGIAANDLDKAATREMVAQLIWNAISGPKMVTYLTNTQTYIPVTTKEQTWFKTTTLGEMVFGLTELAHYVIGNQATGAKATKVIADLDETKAPRQNSISLTYTSGLELFGHYVTGWYSVGGRGAAAGDVFYLVDNGTSTTVTAAEYAQVLDTAEFFSTSYADIESTGYVWDYNVLVNNPATKQDVLVALDLDIAQYMSINKYTTAPYLTVKSGANNGATQTISLAKATGYENIALGSYVNVLTVNGTYGASDKVFPQKQISVLGAHANVNVKYVDSKTGAITLSDGSVLKSSSDTHQGYAFNVGVGSIPAMWNFRANYVIYTDLFGNFVAARELSDSFYAKMTYAYYITDPAAGEHTFYAQIVKIDGTTETVKLAINAAQYNALGCFKLDWMNNNVNTNKCLYLDVIMTPGKAGYTFETATNLKTIGSISSVVGEKYSTWMFDKYDFSVEGATNYFVDKNTKIIVVDGFGSKLTLTTYNGIVELIGDNKYGYIGEDAIISASAVYSANYDYENYHIDYILVEADDVSVENYKSLIYFDNKTAYGFDAAGYYVNAYIEGKPVQVVVDAKSYDYLQNSGDKEFFGYDVVNGVYVLKSSNNTGNYYVEDYVLTHVEGTAYLYVNGQNAKGEYVQYEVTEDAIIVNLTNVKGVPTTAAELAVAAENNQITVDVETYNYDVVVVYIDGYVTGK